MCLEYISWSVNVAVNEEGMRGEEVQKEETNGVVSVGHKEDLSQMQIQKRITTPRIL